MKLINLTAAAAVSLALHMGTSLAMETSNLERYIGGDAITHICSHLPVKDLLNFSEVSTLLKIRVDAAAFIIIQNDIYNLFHLKSATPTLMNPLRDLYLFKQVKGHVENQEYGLISNCITRGIRWKTAQAIQIVEEVPYVDLLEQCYGEDTSVVQERIMSGIVGGEYTSENHIVLARKFLDNLSNQGNKWAIETKACFLNCGRLGYEENPKEAGNFIEGLILQGDKTAYRLKIESLMRQYNEYGYEFNLLEARSLNDKLVLMGDLEAINYKIAWLLEGGCGYEDTSEFYAMTERMISESDDQAVQRKIMGLYEGKFGYEQNIEAAYELNELLIKQKNEHCIDRKINGLLMGNFGYEINIDAAHDFIDYWASRDSKVAIRVKIEGHTYGINQYSIDDNAVNELSQKLETIQKSTEYIAVIPRSSFHESHYPYEQNPDICTLIEILATNSNAIAIERKISGMALGRYGYVKNVMGAHEYIDQLINAGNIGALQQKIEGMALGILGYEKNPELSYSLNEQLIKKNDEMAIDRKIDGLLTGEYGYEHNIKTAHELIDALSGQGNKSIIQMKVNGLIEGKYGFEKSIKEAHTFLDELVKRGNEFAVETKMRGLLYNETGYEMDLSAARDFIDCQAIQGIHEAIRTKISGIRSAEYGYEEYADINFGERKESIQNFLNELITRGNASAVSFKISELSTERQACSEQENEGLGLVFLWKFYTPGIS